MQTNDATDLVNRSDKDVAESMPPGSAGDVVQ